VSVDNLIDTAQIIAGFAAEVALIITYFTFRNFGESEEIKLAESVFKDIRMLEDKKSDLPGYQSIYEDKYKDWASLFFNTLEWFSFLVNSRKIKDDKIIGFFKDAIIEWYEKIFLEEYYITKEQVNDSNEYKEFKKLYKRLKGIKG
jgi:hypothetical protein